MPCGNFDMSPKDWSRSDIEQIAAKAAAKATQTPRPAQYQSPAIEAILCGVLSAHGVDLFDKVDWVEVGIPESVARAWWVKHQALDELRRADEELQRAIDAASPPEAAK